MTVDNLLFFAKQHIHSDHAKILLAELLNKNPLELLTCLEETVPEDKVEIYKKEVIFGYFFLSFIIFWFSIISKFNIVSI